MTQAVVNEQAGVDPREETQMSGLVIPMEWIAYGILIAMALLLRIGDLDIVPMTDSEATPALAAWQIVYPDAPIKGHITPTSPLRFWTQVSTFSFLGATEFTARIGGIIGGLLLILIPLLFRERIGKARTFLWSVLLALSPVLLVASRFNDPVIWTMVFALLALWAFWKYWDTNKMTHALWGMGALAAMALLSEPGGVVLLAIFLLSVLLALSRTTLSAPERLDLPGDDVLVIARERLQAFPWLSGLGVAAAVVLIVTTGFMLYPAGLSMVSELIETALSGIAQPIAPGALGGWSSLTLLVYQPILILFASVSLILSWRRGEITFIERFLAAWVLVAFIVGLFYRGTGPGHAAWMVIPLTLLATRVLKELVIDRFTALFWFDNLVADGEDVFTTRYWWVKWVLGIVIFGLLLMLSFNVQEVGRSLLTLPVEVSSFGDVVNKALEAPYAQFRFSFLFSVIIILFTSVGFFLAASFWGNENTLQGLGLGIFFFMITTHLISGWNTAVTNADDPAELWYQKATARETLFLRETMFDLATRDSSGFPLIDVSVLADGSTITGQGVVAWLLRDFPGVEYVETLNEVQFDQIILLPSTGEEEPDLGGSYVGQSFALYRTWDLMSLRFVDGLAWWTQRRLRERETPEVLAMLWLRQDVYDGIPIRERP